MVAIGPEPDEDRGGYGGPDNLQLIVPVTVPSLDPFPGPILHQKIYVNHLRQNEHTSRAVIDKIEELINLHPVLAGHIRHPPQICCPWGSPAARAEAEEKHQECCLEGDAPEFVIGHLV